MKLLLDKKLPRTLDAWVTELLNEGPSDSPIETWLF